MAIPPDDAQKPAEQGGPLSLPDEWVGIPPSTSAAPSTAMPTGASVPPFDVRSSAQNSRGLIALALGAGSFLGTVMLWTGVGTVIMLAVVGAGLAGIVMASMALVAVRRGSATNRGVAIAGLVLSILGIAGVVLLYVVVIIALSRWA